MAFFEKLVIALDNSYLQKAEITAGRARYYNDLCSAFLQQALFIVSKVSTLQKLDSNSLNIWRLFILKAYCQTKFNESASMIISFMWNIDDRSIQIALTMHAPTLTFCKN